MHEKLTNKASISFDAQIVSPGKCSVRNAKRTFEIPKVKKHLSNATLYSIFWVLYVLLGSWVFLYFERTTEHTKVDYAQWTQFKNVMNGEQTSAADFQKLQTELQFICSHQLFNQSLDDIRDWTQSTKVLNISIEEKDQYDIGKDWIILAESDCPGKLYTTQEIKHVSEWSYVDAIYYTMTLVTTIGFGHIAPTTPAGKLFSILLALIGVPLTCILMSKNSAMLSRKMFRLYADIKHRSDRSPETTLYLVTAGFLFLGFTVFMVLPSFIFMHVEDWTYIDAVYFTFITISTIGFGDYIAGYNQIVTYPGIYKVFIVLWIMVALGYWILLLSFLQKAIQHNAKALRKTLRRRTLKKKARKFRNTIKRQYASILPQKEHPLHSQYSKEQRFHIMAALVENLSRKSSLYPLETQSIIGGNPASEVIKIAMNASRRKHLLSLRKSIHSDELCSSGSDSEDEDYDSDDENNVTTSTQCDVSFSMDDFMSLTVSIPTTTLPGIEGVVSQVTDEHSPLHDRTTNESGIPGNMSVSVRELMALTLLVSSSEEESDNSVVDTTSEDSDVLSHGGTPLKETIPLIRDILEATDTRSSPEQEPTPHFACNRNVPRTKPDHITINV